MSTLSPSEKGSDEPLAIAEATADFRKSIGRGGGLYLAGVVGCFSPGGSREGGQWPMRGRSRVEEE